jgi:SNF2 family DNA or RNA helicase
MRRGRRKHVERSTERAAGVLRKSVADLSKGRMERFKMEADKAVQSYMNAFQEAVMEHFPGALHLLGRDKISDRDEAVRAFQDPGGPQLIVCATRVAAQGITLTRASNVAFLELEWTPAMHDQAEDRLHRIGQRDAVTAWYLLAADTIDETMARLIHRKRGLIAAVTDGRTYESDGMVDGVVRELRGGKPFRHLRSVV